MSRKTAQPFAVLLLSAALACSAACGSQATAAQDGVIAMEVTEAGYVPDHIKVTKGRPVKLLITRKTDKTCAKEIVLDEYKINTPLPLNKAVSVTFTPTKSGELKYGCSMSKMVSGVITVE